MTLDLDEHEALASARWPDQVWAWCVRTREENAQREASRTVSPDIRRAQKLAASARHDDRNREARRKTWRESKARAAARRS